MAQGAVGNLITAGAVTAMDGGFTSSIRFYDTQNVAQPNLYATNFRLKHVKPRMLLRNTGSEIIAAIPRFIPVPGDPNSFIDLPSISLRPNEIADVDLEPLKGAVYGRSDFDYVSVQMLNNGSPGSLIGALNGQDETRGMTYDVPLRDMGGIRNSTGAYPWRLDHDLSTVVSITNVAPVQSEVVVQVNYPGGPYLLNPRRLAAGETAIYDLKKIRDDRTPDRNGHIIPRSVTGGQFKWFIHGAGSGRLIGRAEMVGPTEGISSSYSCPGGNCPAMFSYAFIDPDDVFLEPFDTATVYVKEVDCDAYGCVGPFSPYVTGWSVYDPGLAVYFYPNGSEAYLVGRNGGTALFQANIRYDEYSWDGLECLYGGVNYTDTQGQAQVPKVDINFNGSRITGQTVDVIVGQEINLTTSVDPSGGTVTDSQWTVSGGNSDRIANYVATFTNPQSATSGIVTNLTAINNSSVDFYWTSGGNGRTAQYSAKVNGKAVSAQVTFNVQRPVVRLSAATDASTNIGFDSDVQLKILQLGDNGGTPGLVFTRTITAMPSGFNGTMQWVQVFNHKNGALTLPNGQLTVNTCGLDDKYPYPLDPGSNQTDLKTSDTPGVRLPSGATQASTDYNATMWLLFRPAGTTGNRIWVPLRKVTWAWSANASFDGSTWNITSASDPHNLSSVDTTNYPTWTIDAETNQQCP
jgi:hypothetical protein